MGQRRAPCRPYGRRGGVARMRMAAYGAARIRIARVKGQVDHQAVSPWGDRRLRRYGGEDLRGLSAQRLEEPTNRAQLTATTACAWVGLILGRADLGRRLAHDPLGVGHGIDIDRLAGGPSEFVDVGTLHIAASRWRRQRNPAAATRAAIASPEVEVSSSTIPRAFGTPPSRSRIASAYPSGFEY